ncbi:hypothetical protein [Metabacillus fastidiosus]|uniref:hypothetical protein n=1 Tax=Metabacillus fastidiosus TaxID=1458 RepID=UPI003D2D4770
MEIAEKKELRTLKLKELYEWNDKHGGREANIRFTDLRTNEDEKQEHLAYEYLADKGLINYKILGNNYYMAKITSYGIDYVENEI